MWGYTECKAVSHLLWNYSANRLSADEQALVERHLTTCDTCRAEADAYRQTVDALASMRRDGIPQSRRGWRELQTRLTEPQPRAASGGRWNLPTLGWGVLTAAAGVLAVMFFSNQPISNSPTAGQSSRDVARLSQPSTADSADTQDALPFDDSFLDTYPDASTPSRSAGGHKIRRGPPVVVNSSGLRRIPRRPMRLADARTILRHTYSDGIHGARRASARIDSRHLDGAGSSAGSEAREYVLSPVSATSDSEYGADYVMGGVMMNGRATETEEARGL